MRSGTIALALIVAIGLAVACGGSSNGKNSSQTLKELHDPKSAPTAALGGTPVAPLPANGAVALAGSQPDTYVVKSGDTLGTIAASLNVSVDDLSRANGITDPSRLQIGQQLKVPKAGASPVAGPGTPGAGAALSTVGPAATAPTSGQVPPTGGAPSGVPITGGSPVASGTPGSTSTPAAAGMATAAASAAAGSATEYTVKSGDSACAIAIANGISVQELASANGMTKDQLQRLSVGQLLKIPARTGNKGC